eukprot:3512256-Heterocapsa_arctica.AAC.1
MFCSETVISPPFRICPVECRAATKVPHLQRLSLHAALASVAVTSLGAGHHALPGNDQCATLPVEQRRAKSSP